MKPKLSAEAPKAPLSRRNLLKVLAGSTLVGLGNLSGAEKITGGFEVRTSQDTGWNIFKRQGWSTRPQDISVNYRYLDHVHEAGLNWLIVFWTNAPEFEDAWAKASTYAHSLGFRVARACYVFASGEPETKMAEPNAPAHLLRMSAQGTKVALCPHDPETRAWVAKTLAKRLEAPDGWNRVRAAPGDFPELHLRSVPGPQPLPVGYLHGEFRDRAA